MLFKGFLPNVNHIQKVNENNNDLPSEKKQVKFYESFSGGIFRKKAQPVLNQLSVYNLIRGLEIETKEEVYVKLGELMPTCAQVFKASEIENQYSHNILILQIGKVAELLANVKQLNSNSEEFEQIVKESKKDLAGIKKVFAKIEEFEKKSDKDFITKLMEGLIVRIQTSKVPLESKVYDVIDSKKLEEIEFGDLASTIKTWILEGFDVEKMLVQKDALYRISAFFEMVIPYLNIKGLSFLQYKDQDVSGYLDLALDLTNSILDIRIQKSELAEYSDLIKSVGAKIISPEIELFSTKYSQLITSPTIQTLYISLLTLLSLKVLSSSITSVEKKQEIAKKEEEIKKVEMAKEVTSKQVKSSIEAIEKLKTSGFFESKKIFYTTPRRPYTKEEKEMIPQIKEFVSSLGLIKDAEEDWKNEPKFDKILSDAVKNFQGSILVDKETLAADGKIGPNTRNAMRAYLEALKMKMGVIASSDVKDK